jgi:hypothetical protein
MAGRIHFQKQRRGESQLSMGTHSWKERRMDGMFSIRIEIVLKGCPKVM